MLDWLRLALSEEDQEAHANHCDDWEVLEHDPKAEQDSNGAYNPSDRENDTNPGSDSDDDGNDLDLDHDDQAFETAIGDVDVQTEQVSFADRIKHEDAHVTLVIIRESGANVKGRDGTSVRMEGERRYFKHQFKTNRQGSIEPAELQLPEDRGDFAEEGDFEDFDVVRFKENLHRRPVYAIVYLSGTSANLLFSDQWRQPGGRVSHPPRAIRYLRELLHRIDGPEGAAIRLEILQPGIDGSSTECLSFPYVQAEFGKRNLWQLTIMAPPAMAMTSVGVLQR